MEQAQKNIDLGRFLLIIKENYQKFSAFIVSEDGFRYLAMLPLFFNWIPILIFKGDIPSIKKSCIYSMLFSGYFFVCLAVSIFLNMLPFIGPVLATLVHLVGTVTYLGLCGFFIYSYHRNKTLDLAVVDKHYEYLVTNLF